MIFRDVSSLLVIFTFCGTESFSSYAPYNELSLRRNFRKIAGSLTFRSPFL